METKELSFRDRIARMGQTAEGLRNIARDIAVMAAVIAEESDRMANAAAKYATRREERKTNKASR